MPRPPGVRAIEPVGGGRRPTGTVGIGPKSAPVPHGDRRQGPVPWGTWEMSAERGRGYGIQIGGVGSATARSDWLFEAGETT